MSDAAPSRLDDYLDVFVSPSELFRRRSDGKFGQALLVLVVAFAVMFFVTRTAMQPIMDAEFDRQMAAAAQANPNMTPEAIAAARRFAGIGAGVFVIIGFPIAVLILGAAVWLAARLIGKRVTFAQGATIITFAMFPRLIDSVSGAVQALLMDEASLNSRYAVSLGLGRFMDPVKSNPLLLALLGRVDVFTIWVTVLIVIGLKVMAKASTAQAVGAAVLVWFIGGLPVLLQALRT